jgi:hypothetical protein
VHGDGVNDRLSRLGQRKTGIAKSLGKLSGQPRVIVLGEEKIFVPVLMANHEPGIETLFGAIGNSARISRITVGWKPMPSKASL